MVGVLTRVGGWDGSQAALLRQLTVNRVAERGGSRGGRGQLYDGSSPSTAWRKLWKGRRWYLAAISPT